jgi:hypothetical protein
MGGGTTVLPSSTAMILRSASSTSHLYKMKSFLKICYFLRVGEIQGLKCLRGFSQGQKAKQAL